jgi:hypothetical protein
MALTLLILLSRLFTLDQNYGEPKQKWHLKSPIWELKNYVMQKIS